MNRFRICYVSGREFWLEGELKILPSIYEGHPHVRTPFIDTNDNESVALDPRARVYLDDNLVFEGCTTEQLSWAQKAKEGLN